MSEPETLAKLGAKGRHALDVFLSWVASGRTGSLTFHFSDGIPQKVETTDKLKLGEDQQGPLTVVG